MLHCDAEFATHPVATAALICPQVLDYAVVQYPRRVVPALSKRLRMHEIRFCIYLAPTTH